MKIRRAVFVCFGITLLSLVACERKSAERNLNIDKNGLFDIPGLIAGQINLLKWKSVIVTKTSFIGENREESYFEPDTAFWRNELTIFSELNLNKPSLRDQYIVSEYDSLDYHTIKYNLREKKAEGITLVLIILDHNKNVVEIKATIANRNMVYYSFRELTMQFHTDNSVNGPILSGYSVSGYQKMLFRDMVSYRIVSELKYQ